MARRIARKSEKFKDFLHRVEGIDPSAEGSELFILDQESRELDEIAHGFRHSSLKTQLQQDSHLELYRSWAKVALCPSEADDIDKVCFPSPSPSTDGDPFKRLASHLRRFLVYALRKCVPRSNQDDCISYRVLVHYRRSMSFWVVRKYRERGIEPPSSSWIQGKMTEIMRLLQKHVQIRSHRATQLNRSRVGTWELMMMMDFDLRETPCIELTECHHLAWVIGRVAAVRPGSLAMAKHQGNRHLPYLVWGDLDIQRTDIEGMFYVKMTIRNLKTNSVDPEQEVDNKTLVLSLHSPKGPLTFELSAPHRILTIALRRGVLSGINTIDELFRGQEKNIIIKDEFKDKPVLLKGAPRGMSVKENEPMPSGALTDYLKLRGTKTGLTESITFYSIRRNTAQHLLSKVGADTTRAIMAHDPDSIVMEKYYTVDRTMLPDLTSLAIDDAAGGDANNRPLDGSLAFSRLNKEQMRRVSPMLNVLFRELREIDDEYPHDGDSKAQRNRDRVLRRAALQSVMKDLADEQRRRITIDESNMMARDLQSLGGEFNRRVLDQAKQYTTIGPDESTDEGDRALSTVGIDLECEFPEDEDVSIEEDAEDQFQDQIDRGEEVDAYPDELSDATVDIGNDLSKMDYATAARAAMEVWLAVGTEESQFGTKQKQGSMVICPLCRDDDTVDAETKAKLWVPSKLPRHMDGDFHSGLKKFIRRAQNTAREEGLRGPRCEICVAIAPSSITIPWHSSIKTLLAHVKSSTATKLVPGEAKIDEWWADREDKAQLCAAHDQVKRDLGWYDADFRGSLKHKAKSRAETDDYRNKRLATLSPAYSFANYTQLERPIPIGGGLQLGSTPGWINNRPGIVLGPIPGSGESSTTSMEESAVSKALKAAGDKVTFTPVDQLQPPSLPERYRPYVTMGHIPTNSSIEEKLSERKGKGKGN
ncbi:hypothetical protein CEP51_016253 [Fusarium floridanum]|uniref:Uncharacterized protein n=1 Tax=Fusarium floridanum TaxID=1325733 RepID=A0A428NU03_9HYPO|nr:hypothetical protein CEP51_016253 [Fusarium floridanum]